MLYVRQAHGMLDLVVVVVVVRVIAGVRVMTALGTLQGLVLPGNTSIVLRRIVDAPAQLSS